MSDAVVFNPNNQLEFQEVRMNVTRIPEVMARVREAQAPWESALGSAAGDLASFVVTEDERFAAAPRRRLVTVGVIQVGLFDRFVRAHGEPRWLIGAGEGPLSVVTGRRPLSDFVLETARATRISSVTPTWWRKVSEFTWGATEAPPTPPERFVAIGPGGTGVPGFACVDSIDLDTALAWFWTSLSANGLSIAN